MKNQEAITLVKNAKIAYEYAVAHKMNVAAKKQEYINILMSHAGELLAAADEAAEFEEQFALECAESARLRRELNELKSNSAEEQEMPAPEKRKKNG